MGLEDRAILICGLGSLGQACVERLLPFQVPLTAIDLEPPQWRREAMAERITQVVQGDMREGRVLEQAGIRHCRAVLLLSADSQVNLEAALLVRVLNPEADVVVRSNGGQQAIGHLLEQRLPKVAVVDPVVLTAGALASAVHPREGLIQLETDGQGDSISVVSSSAQPPGVACRCLRRQSKAEANLWITLRHASRTARATHSALRQALTRAARWWRSTWRGMPRRQLAWLALAGLAVVVMGLVLFSERSGDWRRALLITLGLLQGEYVDPVMLLSKAGLGKLIAALSYALLGTLITSALVALILERLLSQRLGLQRGERISWGSQQVLIVDGHQVVEPIRSLLATEHIGIQTASLDGGMGELEMQIEQLRHTKLVGIGLLSTNLLANVHAALVLQQQLEACRIAVLSHEMESSDQLGALLGGISVISGMDLAADAFVATAFGERVERVIQIDGLNHLLVRYKLEKGDQLCGYNIARLENGYGLNVLSHRRNNHAAARAIPPLDWPLQPGDEITVLANLDSLRRVECGQIDPPQWRVELRMGDHPQDNFLVRQCLARFLGMAPGLLQSWCDGFWHQSEPLDRDLAELMCRDLQRLRVETRLIRDA